MQKEYEGFTTVEIEDPYFVEVENGYITEESLKSICQYIGDMYDIPPALLQAVAWVESNYKVDARGSSGDSGLCQVIPGYHLARMEKLGVTDIMDPYGNVLVAADLINDISNEWYKDRSAVDWGYVIMHYNQGYNAKESYQQYGLSSHAQKVMSKYYEIIGG